MGKSSSQVVGYRYYAKFAVFIGNRIEKLLSINFDKRGWIKKKTWFPYYTIDKPDLYGENEGGVAGVIYERTGLPDGEVDPIYQAYQPLASGYPYQSYLIFSGLKGIMPVEESPELQEEMRPYHNSGFYLGNSGYMKEMLLWVKRIHVRNDGRAQWYDLKAEIEDAVVYDYGQYDDIESLLSAQIVANYKKYDGTLDVWDGTIVKNGSRVSLSDSQISGQSGSVDYSVLSAGFYRINVRVSSRMPQTVSLSGAVNVLSKSTSFSEDGILLTTDYYHYFTFLELEVSGPFSIKVSCTANPDYYRARVYCDFSIDRFSGQTPQLSGDINPIHKIREILTDDTAMAKSEFDVNDQNFIKAANRIFDEGFGISWAIDEKSCIEAIEELCYHIESGIRVNRQTGLYEMVLFRDDWFAEDEIHDIAENKIKNLSLEVMNSDDIVNQLNVTYYDRSRIKSSSFSVYENGSILTMGHANAESVEFPYFMNMRNAEIVANWKLKQFSTPAWSGSFTTGWHEARKWNRYDLIRLPWSSKWNGTILVRLMKINLGNGADNTVTIDFEEVIPYSGEMNTSIVVDTPIDATPQSPQPSINAVFEAPYYLTVLKSGQTSVDANLSNNPDIGHAAAIAAKPQSNSLNALLYTDGGVGEFEQVSRLDYCDILQLDQSIIETNSSFTVTGSLTQTASSNNLILLNDELMGFVGFDNETKVLTVRRGVLDTVPKKHSSGSLFVFDLPDVAFDSTQYAQGENIEVQVLTTTPSGIQDLSATGTAVEIQARAIRPYPPANVKINGEYWPDEIEGDLIITWVDRNRVQQTGGEIIGWYEDGVIIESAVNYQLVLTEFDENLIELRSQSISVGTLNTYTFSVIDMSANARSIEIVLKSVRDGYECLNPFIHIVDLLTFFTAPYDITYVVSEI